MKVFAAVAAFVAATSAAAVPATPVSYDGYKVFRVPVGKSTAPIDAIIKKLELETWEYSRQPGSFADLVVSPNKLELFEKQAAKLGAVVMHEDLGASIAEESAFTAFGDDCKPIPSIHHIATMLTRC